MNDDLMNYPIVIHEEILEPSHHQQQIRSLHTKIDKLQKRLDDTKTFCDSLWDQLKDYER